MQLETQEFRAEAKFQRVSPQKARLVLELIKGRRVGDALDTVAFTKKGVAPLDHSSRHGGTHHRGAQRQKVYSGLRDGEHGRAQAGRIFRHADVQGALGKSS